MKGSKLDSILSMIYSGPGNVVDVPPPVAVAQVQVPAVHLHRHHHHRQIQVPVHQGQVRSLGLVLHRGPGSHSRNEGRGNVERSTHFLGPGENTMKVYLLTRTMIDDFVMATMKTTFVQTVNCCLQLLLSIDNVGFIRSDLSYVYNCMVLVGLIQDWFCWVTCNVEIELINSFTRSDLRLISELFHL